MNRKIIYISLVSLITFIFSMTYFSYAFFTNKNEQHGKLNIVVGKLNYKINSQDLTNDLLVMAAGEEKEVTITITSLNSFTSEYQLYYESDGSVEVSLSEDTLANPNGTIAKDESKTINLIIKNLLSTSNTITFGVEGGFVGQELALEHGNAIVGEEEKLNITVDLYKGMVPVYYKNGDTYVADTNKKWYNYEKREWANAVLVSNTSDYFNEDGSIKDSMKNQKIDSGILQYYVYIPRYKYKLFSNATNINNLISSGNTPVQIIEVEFVGTDTINDSTKAQDTGYRKGEWYVHPSFTFGSKELNGIWVGKFETTGTAENITILPNQQSLSNLKILDAFNLVRTVENGNGLNSEEVDSHIMKSMDWGVVAYLSNSKYGRYIDENTCVLSGCRIWNNNTNVGTSLKDIGTSITGCSATSFDEDTLYNSTSCVSGSEWNGANNNGRSSTTGNIYGIYDMSGGTFEYIMANTTSSGTADNIDKKYFTEYYNKYSSREHKNSKLGDAIRECLVTFRSYDSAWYNSRSHLARDGEPRMYRGGGSIDLPYTSIFAFSSGTGVAVKTISFRIVLTKDSE